MDNNVEKCIFIGYKDGIKYFKPWNPIPTKIFYSQDVVIIEVEISHKH